MAKGTGKEEVVTVVPLHEELKLGILLGVLELARITRRNSLKAYQRGFRKVSSSMYCSIGVGRVS